MRRHSMWVAGLAALAASTALAAPDVGDRAPEISAGTWINLPAGMSRLSLGDLKGQVALVEFWATW